MKLAKKLARKELISLCTNPAAKNRYLKTKIKCKRLPVANCHKLIAYVVYHLVKISTNETKSTRLAVANHYRVAVYMLYFIPTRISISLMRSCNQMMIKNIHHGIQLNKLNFNGPSKRFITNVEMFINCGMRSVSWRCACLLHR